MIQNTKRRVALLTNILPHYRIPLLVALQELVGELKVFLSARMERGRDWPVFWASLDVVVQRSLSWTHNFRNVHGYRDSSQIHVPYDTLFQLWRYKPEVVVSGEFGTRTLMAAVYRLLVPETALIVWATLSEHTEATRGRMRILLRRWILKRADAAFVNGKSGAAYLRSLGFDGPIAMVPYVVENTAFTVESQMDSGGLRRLLYSGQLIERKGLHLFLPVLGKWCADHKETSVQFRLVGDGPERGRIESLKLAPNLKLELTGSVSPASLPDYYRSASMFVFPTLGDEWGTVINEALCAGLPVLGSRYSQAVEELIREGKNGWVFNPVDQRDTYEAIDRALGADRDTLNALSAHARESIASLTPEAVAATMACAIQTAAKRAAIGRASK
jgi:glycosyltransferase involved in cell wall biosynthesis